MVKKSNHFYLGIGILLIAFIEGGCKGRKEAIPFFDGLYFTYQQSHTLQVYRIYAKEDGNFEVNYVTHLGELTSETKIIVNSWGKILKSEDEDFYPQGSSIIIWLPERKRCVNGSFLKARVRGKKHWGKWHVWVIEHFFGYDYYETNTGFWVGNSRCILVDTNADIPEVESVE